jgi:TPP-dependent 2-oxoacid decarboxylase
MCRIESLFLLQTERKHVGRRAQFQQHRDASCRPVFLSLQGKALKQVHAILAETLEQHTPSYATVIEWVARFKCDDFSTCDAPCPGQPKTVTTLSHHEDQILDFSG